MIFPSAFRPCVLGDLVRLQVEPSYGPLGPEGQFQTRLLLSLVGRREAVVEVAKGHHNHRHAAAVFVEPDGLPTHPVADLGQPGGQPDLARGLLLGPADLGEREGGVGLVE